MQWTDAPVSVPVSSTLNRVFLRCALVLIVFESAVGCRLVERRPRQYDYMMPDHVQYFPEGPELKIPREVAEIRSKQARESAEGTFSGNANGVLRD